jgi:hypothetical protein
MGNLDDVFEACEAAASPGGVNSSQNGDSFEVELRRQRGGAKRDRSI